MPSLDVDRVNIAATIWAYCCIILRDTLILCITTYFLVRVNRRENNLKVVLAKKDSVLDLLDLESVLGSVTPMIAFSKYIDEQYPDYSAMLRFIKLSKIFEQLYEDLHAI